MAIGAKRVWNGRTYHLITEDIKTKAEAQRKANWSGKYSYVRIEKVGRGNYRLWVGPNKPR
jgi:hypothetical protein